MTTMTTTDLRAAARRALPWRGRMSARRAEWAHCHIDDALSPYMVGVWQWLVCARPGETCAAYARRAADHAAMRLGLRPDPAVLRSVATITATPPGA